MRVTADPKDPDYRKEYIGSTVYLDGVEQKDAITADDVAGTVEVLARDDLSLLVIDAAGGLYTKTLHGQVVIELPKPRIFKRGQF